MRNEQCWNQICIENDIIPVYEKLQKEANPIFIWGAGAMANNVHAYCRKFGIKVRGCFTNIPASAEHFQGLPVFEMDKLLKTYSSFSVIIGHSNYEEGLKYLEGFENIRNVYCITALCYGIDNLITVDYINKEKENISNMFANLEDDFSRGSLQAYFEARMNDNAKYMFSYYKKENTYYLNDVFSLTNNELLLDVGACIGNAILSFAESVQGKYKGIIAVEPEEDNFVKLQSNIKKYGLEKVILRKQCIYNQNGYVNFKGEAEYGGICGEKETCKRYQAITIDSLCKELAVEQEVSIIKINFAFAVSEVLAGAKATLQEVKPKLIIRVGFDENVLLDTYKAIKKINPQYKIYLRYTIGIPQGLTLFAI